MADLPGQSQVNDANSQGQSAINGFDPTKIGGTLNQGFNDLKSSQLGSGPQNANDYLGAYAKTIAQNPTVTSLYNTGNNMFNVPQLQTTATKLNNAVTNETPNAYNLARGFDYNDAQVQNKINTDLRFMEPQANAATANANTASNLASNFVQAGQAQNAQNLLPIQSYGPLLQQALAAQATGWTQDAQNTFAGLQAKMAQGVALSTQEMQSLAQLTQAKEQYDSTIASQQGQLQQAQLPYSQGQTIQAGSYFYNPSTGQNQYFK